jgi:hypothetical protein
MPELRDSIHATGRGHLGVADRGIIALANEGRLRRILTRMLDENEFLSPYGIRSLSRYHADHPYVFAAGGQEYRVGYLPAESDTGMFGGNSNWRGPVWAPANAPIIRALLHYYAYYGDDFRIECPTGSARLMNLFEVARDISDRLARLFLRDGDGRRPVFGGVKTFQNDPHWRDHPLFYEYFHGDNGAGIGASHQTGWTGVVAMLMQLFRHGRGRVVPAFPRPAPRGSTAAALKIREEFLQRGFDLTFGVTVEAERYFRQRHMPLRDPALSAVGERQAPRTFPLGMRKRPAGRVERVRPHRRAKQPVKIRLGACHDIAVLDRRAAHPPATGGQIASTSPSVSRCVARALGGMNTPFTSTRNTSAFGIPNGAMAASSVASSDTLSSTACCFRFASGRNAISVAYSLSVMRIVRAGA